jgi:glycosyltransferase involved in cell wall biosynthesis
MPVFTFKSGDVQDLQRMLNLLLHDDELRQRTVNLAQQHIRQRYLWEDVSKQIEAVYSGLMQQPATEISSPEARAKIA